MAMIEVEEYHKVVKKLRDFFEAKGFMEVPAQSRKSILAACEDPSTITEFNYEGQIWPLPQTGQMWLEYELLKKPSLPGLYAISTSYRQEPNPIPGRHETIFPMFEFEIHGGIDALRAIEIELLEYLGFKEEIVCEKYDDVASRFGIKELETEHETKIGEEVSNAYLLEYFPQYTSPFWNMKKVGDHSAKIDVILHGQETIGSAERSCDVEEMRDLFHTISDGEYAEILYNKFGKERVEAELEEFLAHEFFPRSGGGIGITRLIRALKLSNLL